MDTIRITGIRPKDNDIVIGLYTSIYIDAVFRLDLSKALLGDDTHAIDIPQVSDRLALMLRRCQNDDEIMEHPTIALELIANSVADSAMRTWQISEAHITVHASLRSAYYGLESTVDDVAVTLRRVAPRKFDMGDRAIPESVAKVAVRSGRVVDDDLDYSPMGDYYRSLIEEDEKEKKIKEDAEAAAAAKAAEEIANADIDGIVNEGQSQDDAENDVEDYAENYAEIDAENRIEDIDMSDDECPVESSYLLPLKSTLVVSMKGVANQATRSAMLRTVALLEQDTNACVDGVSALYVVNALEGDLYSVTLIFSSTTSRRNALRLVSAVAKLQKDTLSIRVLGARSYGVPATKTKKINPEGLPQDIAEMVTVEPKAPELMPWMQIESDAALDDETLAYSLAFDMSAQNVGIYSEHWLIGDDY